MTFATAQILTAQDLDDIVQISALAADQTSQSSTTPTPCYGLSLELKAGTRYAIDGYFAFFSTTTADIKFALDIPSGSGGRWGVEGVQSGSAYPGPPEWFLFDDMFGSANGYGNAGAGTSTPLWGNLSGYISTFGAGTLQVLFAQTVSEATFTTMKAGSWIRAAILPA